MGSSQNTVYKKWPFGARVWIRWNPYGYTRNNPKNYQVLPDYPWAAPTRLLDYSRAAPRLLLDCSRTAPKLLLVCSLGAWAAPKLLPGCSWAAAGLAGLKLRKLGIQLIGC